MKIATYNMHFGTGQDGKLDLARVVEAVADCDIIGFQEVDQNWDRSGNIDQVAELARLLPDHDFIYGPGVDVAKQGADGKPAVRLRRRTGNATFCRAPILATRNDPLPKFGGATALDIQKSALEVSVDTAFGAMRIVNTHLCHLSEAMRARQIELIMDRHHRAQSEGPQLSGAHPKDKSFTSEPPLPEVPELMVLLGDMNFEPEGPAYTTLLGAFHSNHWRRPVPRRGLIDAWSHLEDRAGPNNLEGAFTSANAPRRIDFVFLSERLGPHIKAVEVRDHVKASDHYPVVVTLG